MNKLVFNSIIENEKLFSHFKEQSYWIKELNRNPNAFKVFKDQMKIIYRERASDKINDAIDSIDMVSSIIDTLN